nr:adenylyltransferase/cytidyltransferase family protein [Candidatus Gracilibacteria bacterium]
MSLGIIIGRFNPLHIGHISLINSSINKCDKTIIILGSANVINENNPFSKDERYIILKKEFGDYIYIDHLDDCESDIEWIRSLDELIRKYCNFEDKITFFGGDLKNDYAINAVKIFQKELKFKNINFFEKHRDIIPISATKIRNHLQNNEHEEAKKWLSDNTKHTIIKKYVD